MSKIEDFKSIINKGYSFDGRFIMLGGAMLNGECVGDTHVKLPLSMMNRHGLIAGATGSGKTKTLQIIAEQLSTQGVPVVMMDIKGDLSGIATPSDGDPKIDERHAKIGIPFEPDFSPVEFLTLSANVGAQLRATISEFGPVLFSKVLRLNDTQSSIVAVLFKYCDDNDLPLLDLKDFKKTLQYVSTDGKADLESEYGRISAASVGAIMRKIVELEQQGAELCFGERSFDVDDLTRLDAKGKGIVSIVRLEDIQDKPKLFSTYMLQMLAEIYASFPEEGDLDAPKLVMFIDEAHLIFDNASDALMDQIEVIIKLIRSKGVGLYFVTQNPTDVPDTVLSQLGLKVQHALRAFTAKDRRAIKLVSQNYPITEHYDVETLLTELGIGEALVTVLNEDGIPSPLVHTMLRAPQSRMDVLYKKELEYIISQSVIIDKYNEVIDRESAYEILTRKINAARELAHEMEDENKKYKKTRRRRSEKSPFEKVLESTTTRQIGRTVARELTRGLLGVLGVSTTRRRRRSSWF